MKKLLFILMLGGLFGDSITYKSSVFLTETKQNVTFLGVGKNKTICFETNDKSNNLVDCFPCKSVKKVTSISNEVINYDCNKRTYYGKQPIQQSRKSQLITIIATGLFIPILSIFLRAI